MARSKTPTFVHTLALREASPGALRGARQSSDYGRMIYNATLGELRARFRAMQDSPEYEAAQSLPRKTPEDKKRRSEAFDAVRLFRGLTEFEAQEIATQHRKSQPDFSSRIGSHVAQTIGSRAWKSIKGLIFAKAKRIRFKRKGNSFSLEALNNATFLRILPNESGTMQVHLVPHLFDLVYDIDNPYDVHALSSRLKYLRLIWKKIGGVDKLYAQLVLEGLPHEDKEKAARHKEEFLSKMEAESGQSRTEYALELSQVEEKYRDVATVDIGPRGIAITNAVSGYEREICPGMEDRQKEIRRLQRRMDRSRLAANPDNYEADGQIKKGKKTWVQSNAYKSTQAELAEIRRKQQAHRKSIHGNLANEVLQYGTTIKLEALSYKGMQKRYGKSTAHHAPSAFIGELTRKAVMARGRRELINTFDTALSQTCPGCGSREKKPLSQRKHRCKICMLGTNVAAPRDLTSAFLAVFTDNTDSVGFEETTTKKRGKKKLGHSKLDREAAARHLPGHRTLSLAGSTRPKHAKGETNGPSPKGGSFVPLDASAKKRRTSLEPRGMVAKTTRSREEAGGTHRTDDSSILRDAQRIPNLRTRRKTKD